MRAPILPSLLGLLLLSPLATLAQQKPAAADALSIQTASSVAPSKAAAATGEDDATPSSTVFNGVEVPPMKELSGDEFDQEIKEGYS